MSKTVLITGATGGLGSAMVLQLASDGFDLVLHYHSNAKKADELILKANQAGVKARKLQFSVADRAQTNIVLTQDVAEYGAYYGVICNAGIIRDNAFPAMSGEEWDQVIHTNLDGFYNVLHPLIMPMVRARKGGRIVTIASVSGIMGNRGQTNYSASKGGLIAATKSLAIELAKRNITVNCVAPGIIETEMTEDLDLSTIKDIVPLRRAGKAEEVASLVAYLMSEQAAYVTRQVISINGGMF
ncbi:MAG: 3-oxoacyl-ACP reductase FabG [Marinicella sp.]|nr:3-oxoacyl-ACP reductase FabG [Xanthomonadales bacterium]